MAETDYGTQKLYEEKVFKDPIHRYIHVKDQVIWDLVKTKEFQRLRRIKQLGTLYLSFHTAMKLYVASSMNHLRDVKHGIMMIVCWHYVQHSFMI